MIVSFGDEVTEDLFNGVRNKQTRAFSGIKTVIERKLDMLNAAGDIKDLRSPPANRLEKLKGALRKYHSIRVNDQYRLIFVWENTGAHNVTITDYH